MGSKKDEVRIERVFYPNGQIQAEVSYRGEHIVGTTRYWYESGTLKSEVPVRNSIICGVVRTWDETGKLLDETRFVNGTGVSRSFHPNGLLSGEVPMKQSVPHGCLRTWDESGELIAEAFFNNGRPTSRKRFESTEQGALASGAETREAVAEFIAELLKDPSRTEALTWAKERNGTLGETYTNADSIALIEKLYNAGAEEVAAVDIDTEMEDSENTGQLIVKLPKSDAARQRLLAICNSLHEDAGYTAEDDLGQEHILIVFE